MKQHKLKYLVEKICKVLQVSSSGYYHWLKNGPSKLWLENQNIITSIEQIFEDTYQSYGAPRMSIELEKRGFKVSRPRTVRKMRGMGGVKQGEGVNLKLQLIQNTTIQLLPIY